MTLLTTAQAARELGVDASTIRLWCRLGKIKGARRMGRDWVMDAAALKGLSVGAGGKRTHKPK